jgi:hypothetical protein
MFATCAPSPAQLEECDQFPRRLELHAHVSCLLSQAANPLATTFVDAIDSVYDSTIPYDIRFYI